MPVAKVNKIEYTYSNTFKNLRRRKVPCQVPFYGPKATESLISPPSTKGAPNSKFVSVDQPCKSSQALKLHTNNVSKNSRLLRSRLAGRRSLSANSLDESSPPSSSPVVHKLKTKKSNRKKTIGSSSSPEYVRRTRSKSVCSLDNSSPKTPQRTDRKSSRKQDSEHFREDEFAATPAHTTSTKPKSMIKLEPQSDECSGLSSEKSKKRVYRRKSYAQRMDGDFRIESKRRARSLCTLSCCNSLPSTLERSKRNRTYTRRSLFNMSTTASPKDKKLLKSSMFYDEKDGLLPTSQVVVEFRKKRIYHKKGVCDVISMKPKKKPKISLLNFEDSKLPSATVVVDIFKRKTYRKKNSDVSTVSSNKWSRSEISTPDLADDNAIFTPTKMMPQSDDVPGLDSILEPSPYDNGEINFSQSTVTASETSDYLVQHQDTKRGRGRPRKISLPSVEACPVLGSGLSTDDELTCTSSTMSTATRDSQTGGRRPRKKRWPWEDDEEQRQQEEEEVSEYELLRRRNIEENMKMLRQIFMDQGLQLDEKSCDTPKMRKNYTRLPPPPPRPKSARIEVKHSSGSLDFSKFCHRHSVL